MIPRKVAPTGEGLAWVCPGFQPIPCPTYLPSREGRSLRALRLHADLSLGEAARLLGCSTVEYSGLERGSYTLDTEAWLEAFASLVAEAERKIKPLDLETEG